MKEHQHSSPGDGGPGLRVADGTPRGAIIARAVVHTYWTSRWILNRSWQILRQDGLKGVESTVLWGGRRFGNEAVVMAVLYPCGRDVAFEAGFVHVGSDTTAEMGRWLRSQGLVALAQVHTHPGAWTGHSKTDDDFPIASSEGFLSLVWPHYAAKSVERIEELGVHQLIGGEWQHVSDDGASSLLRIFESDAMVWVPHIAPRPVRERTEDAERTPGVALLDDET